MGKKEFAVGEEFQCGLVRLRCIEDNGYKCDDCYCYDIPLCDDIVGNCTSKEREDNTEVIFVKVEE